MWSKEKGILPALIHKLHVFLALGITVVHGAWCMVYVGAIHGEITQPGHRLYDQGKNLRRNVCVSQMGLHVSKTIESNHAVLIIQISDENNL
jgi:hypothetical protein